MTGYEQPTGNQLTLNGDPRQFIYDSIIHKWISTIANPVTVSSLYCLYPGYQT